MERVDTQDRLDTDDIDAMKLPVELLVIIAEILLADTCFGTLANLNLASSLVHQETLSALYETVIWTYDMLNAKLDQDFFLGEDHIKYLILEPVENAESSKRARHFANMDLSSVFANIRLVVDSGPDAVPREDKKEESPPVSLADTAVTVYHPVSWATLATTVKCTAASARYRPPKTSDGCNELVSLFHEMPFTDAIFSGNQVSRINFIRDGDFRRHEHDGDDLPKLSLGHMGNNFRFEVHAVGEASQALRRETIECLFSTGKMRNLPSTQWKGSLTMVPAMMNAMARLVDKEFTLSDHGMPPILDLVPPVSTSDLISALKQCLPAYFAARREFYNSGRRLPALWEHNRAFDWTSRSNELRWDLIGGSLLPMLWIVGSENKQWVDVYCADVKLGNGMVQLGVFVCVIDSSDAPLVLERHYTELL